MGTLYYAKYDLSPLFLELSKIFLKILYDIKGYLLAGVIPTFAQ